MMSVKQTRAPRNLKKTAYVRAKEASEIAGVTVQTIWNWARNPKLLARGFPAPQKITDGVTVFSKHELIRFLENR